MIKSISYDSDVGDSIEKGIKNAAKSLKEGIASKLSSDFGALSSAGIFSAQLSSIEAAVNGLIDSYESFVASISNAKSSWKAVQQQATQDAKEFAQAVQTGVRSSNRNYGGGTSYRNSGGGSTSKPVASSGELTEVDKGKDVSLGDIEVVLSKLDSSTLPILLQKLSKLSSDGDVYTLLTDKEKSKVLATLLKKILGDPSEDAKLDPNDTEAIQKALLGKIEKEGIDPTTEEGRAKLKEFLEEQLKEEVDDSTWDKMLYGDNTKKIEYDGGNWIVAKTKRDVKSYVAAIAGKVTQDANSKEWSDKCLAFAYAHQYDLYTGDSTDGKTAANYGRGIATTYCNTSKEETLAKIYDEIMNGRPVILQVNGKTRESKTMSRHFVTVVGFKEGVVCGASLKETDMLIIDSWDGKLERMDTTKSRFMTTGEECNKDYKGYRLGVIKS